MKLLAKFILFSIICSLVFSCGVVNAKTAAPDFTLKSRDGKNVR